jgi:methyltransferase (TIGR00027 family)
VHGAWPKETIMPTHLKELVRARMEKTGESYQQALRHVRAQEGRSPAVPSSSPAEERVARSRTVADTAFSIAVVRAEEESLPPGEQLFADPYAPAFAGAGVHAAESTQRFLDLPFFREAIRLRTRFLDDCVRDGLEAGLDQVVLLGAGFDARGLRMPEIVSHRATVFEVDTPYQLDRKQRALASTGVKLPPHVAYVPFDFETTDFDAELRGALGMGGFRAGAGAMFVWEGVIGYIDDATMDQTLRFITSAGGPRSRVAFTYADEAHLGMETMAARTKRCGFGACESFAGDALWRRYLPGEPHPNAWVTKVGLATV